jgi:hypothetical protein
MANGDFVNFDSHRFAVKLLDGQVASDDGVWVEVPPQWSVRSFWCDITAEASGTPKCDIYVSNALTKPANSTNGVLLVSLTPAAPYSTQIVAYRWTKAKKTAGGTPAAVNCVLEAGSNE